MSTAMLTVFQTEHETEVVTTFHDPFATHNQQPVMLATRKEMLLMIRQWADRAVHTPDNSSENHKRHLIHELRAALHRVVL
jgi:hypothetical protein